MKRILSILFPAKADNTVRGTKLPLYFFILIAVIGTVRSCIHIFSHDGGAGSIAGMNLDVSGANEVIFAFALWGVQLLETLGRILVGQIKPVTFAHTPPGAYQNYIYLVLSVAMLVLSLWSGRKALRESKPS